MRINISKSRLLSKVDHLKAKPSRESGGIEIIAPSHHPTCCMLLGSWFTSTDEYGNEIITPKPTTHGDEFSTGCILFYFLKIGLHPFGSQDKDSFLTNIKETDLMNLKGTPQSLAKPNSFSQLRIIFSFI
jgi:hypothetical protein